MDVLNISLADLQNSTTNEVTPSSTSACTDHPAACQVLMSLAEKALLLPAAVFIILYLSSKYWIYVYLCKQKNIS